MHCFGMKIYENIWRKFHWSNSKAMPDPLELLPLIRQLIRRVEKSLSRIGNAHGDALV